MRSALSYRTARTRTRTRFPRTSTCGQGSHGGGIPASREMSGIRSSAFVVLLGAGGVSHEGFAHLICPQTDAAWISCPCGHQGAVKSKMHATCLACRLRVKPHVQRSLLDGFKEYSRTCTCRSTSRYLGERREAGLSISVLSGPTKRHDHSRATRRGSRKAQTSNHYLLPYLTHRHALLRFIHTQAKDVKSAKRPGLLTQDNSVDGSVGDPYEMTNSRLPSPHGHHSPVETAKAVSQVR